MEYHKQLFIVSLRRVKECLADVHFTEKGIKNNNKALREKRMIEN